MDSPKEPPRTRDFKARTGVDRSKAAKLFIDTYYKDLLGQQEHRAKRHEQLEKETHGLTPREKKERELAHQQAETDMLRQRRHKLSVQDFENIKVIGRGAFGEVRLVSEKVRPGEEQKIFAMKIMNKEFVIEKNQLAHARAERDAMVEHDDPGIVKLYYSFQDSNFLYFVMEYLPGGDLMNLLINKHTLGEDECKFYLMEIICAVHNTHLRGYIHRDLKPDNILVCQNGHVKLTDFGLCTSGSESHLSSFYQTSTKSKLDEEKPKRLEKSLTTEEKQATWNRMRREKSYSTVGTSNYMAPEILLEQGYDHYIDWWAVGIIMYECLCGYAPFSCEDPTDTCMLILDWQNSFEFPPPEECTLSNEAVDLIRRLVTGRKGRYGYNEIVSHPWFKGFDPKTIYEQKAPWLPPIKSPTDTQNFDEFDDPNLKFFFGDETELSLSNKSPLRELDEKQLPFVGWTYRRFEQKSKPRVASIFPGQAEADEESTTLGSARDEGSVKKRTPPKKKKDNK